MSNIVIQVNGSSAGDGFLIAPDNGITFSVPLNVRTNDGSTVSATIDATPNGAGVTLPGGSMRARGGMRGRGGQPSALARCTLWSYQVAWVSTFPMGPVDTPKSRARTVPP